jgi:hypothetical protein
MAPPRLKLVAFPVAYQIFDMLEVPLYDYQIFHLEVEVINDFGHVPENKITYRNTCF